MTFIFVAELESVLRRDMMMTLSRSCSETLAAYLILLFAPLLTWVFAWCSPPDSGSILCMSVLFGVAVLLYHVPAGGVHFGPLTKGGNRPSYPDNGLYHITVVTLCLFLGGGYGWWDVGVVSRSVEGGIWFLNGVALLVCLLLLVTGLKYGSPPDDGTLGKGVVYDFYSGVWLHPRLFGMDLKLLINSRFSMTFWWLHSMSSMWVSLFDHGEGGIDWGVFLCAASQVVYLFGFFLQEAHYVHTIDIIEDRAGFYETWGCLVWVPSIYTLHTRVGLRYGSGLNLLTSCYVFGFGVLAWFFNVWSNEQRKRFRQDPTKPLLIHGSDPTYVEAVYQVIESAFTSSDDSSDSETASPPRVDSIVQKKNLLLTSGWWGWVRHPQYIFDILHSLTWGILGGGLTSNPLAMFYPLYITILLFHRSVRDEKRCLDKYGEAYRTYMKQVPYKIIPGVW